MGSPPAEMPKPRLLLVHPGLRDGRRVRFYLTDFSGAEAPGAFVFPPLELLYAASLARRAGIEVLLLDGAGRRKPPEWIVRGAEAFGPTHIVVPTPLGDLFPLVEPLITALHEAVPRARIAVFGPEVTSDPGLGLRHPAVDAVITAEPDVPITAWVLGDRDVPDLTLRGAPDPPGRRATDDLDALPPPARELLRPGDYWAPFSHDGPFATVWGARGCSYGRCRFCPSKLWRDERAQRHHSPEYVLDDLRRIRALGYREAFFKNQVFTADPEWVAAVCEGLLRDGRPLGWRCMTRVDCADEGLFRLMKRAGCYQVSLGFESADQETLDANDKGIRLEDSYAAAARVKAAGLELVGNFMIGLYGESDDAAERICAFARELRCDFAQFHALFPNPLCPEDAGLNTEAHRQRFIASVQRSAYLRFYLRPSFVRGRLFMLTKPRMLPTTFHAAYNVVRYGM